MYCHKTTVEIIKLSLQNAEYFNISIQRTLLKSVQLLYEKYLDFQDRKFLKQALQFVYAYIELGFPFEEHAKEFQKLTHELQIPFLEAFPENIWKYKTIRLTKTGINDILGRWNPKLHSMKSIEVVNDIYSNILHMREGKYLYHSGRLLTQDSDDALWEKTFRLFIQSGEAILYDVNKNQYYTFEKRLKTND